MTTSGIYELEKTVNDLLYESYDLLQIAEDGESPSGDLFNRGLPSLQGMLKLFETQGMHLWTETEGHLFLEVGRAVYDFRLKGRSTGAVHLANTFEQRALGAAVSVSDTAATLGSVTSGRTLARGDLLGILGDDNDLEWFTVMQITGLVVSLDTAAATAAASGNIVYTYPLYAATELDTAEAMGAVELGVADTSIFTAGDAILVLLDDGTTDERTVDSIDEGAGTITITSGLTSAAASGNGVVDLSNEAAPFKPVKRIPLNGIRRRESTDYEIPVVNQSREEYFGLPNKNQPGTVIQTYFSRQITQGILYCWSPPINARDIVNFTYERAIQVPTEAEQTLDMPEEWYDAIIHELARRLIPKFGCSTERAQEIRALAKEFLDQALAFDTSMYPIRLNPQKYG